jgi:hypothetical protein
MASVNWSKGKCHGGVEAKRLLRHNDKEMRLKDNHANKNIDKTRTHLNWQMYTGYNATCDRYHEKLDELDAMPGANKRKDRVTMHGLEYAVPDGLPDDKVHEWHMKVLDIQREIFGSDLFIVNSYEHFDEVHEYMHSEKKEMVLSRVHIHEDVIPLHKGKLNDKMFASRKHINKLNREIDKMTKRDYGLVFLTGEKKKSEYSVEELKNQSEIAQISHDTNEKVKSIVDEYKMPVKGKFKDYLATRKVDGGDTALKVLEGWFDEFKDLQKKQASKDIEQAVEQVSEDVISKKHHEETYEEAVARIMKEPSNSKRKTYDDIKNEIFFKKEEEDEDGFKL